jgi:hypothetical protein
MSSSKLQLNSVQSQQLLLFRVLRGGAKDELDVSKRLNAGYDCEKQFNKAIARV